MIKNQRQLAPLTKENIEQLQREFKCNKANDQVSKTEVYHNQTRKGTIARSDGDGESVDVTTNNIEQRRTSSVFYEHKRVLSSGLSVNEETKPANKNKQFDQNSYDQENDREKKVYDGEALGTDINSENHDESNKGLNRTPIHKNDGKSLESLSGKGEKEEVEEDDEKEEERKEKKEETKDQEDEKEEEDEEEEEVEEKDEEIDFEENNNSTSSKKPDNYIAYDSADEVHYNTDDLNEEYDSADEFREFEKQLRENMENAESPTESESEEDPTPDTTSKDIDGDTETLATSRLSSSLLPANELDSDDDDDDDDDFTSEEEQPEEEDEEVDYEYMTSPMESEPATDDEQSEEESVQSALTQEEEENPITEPIEIIPTEEKYNENDAEEEVVTHEDTEFLQDEAATTNENLETRPETRLVSGQSASPHIELESAFGSDQFDEFEGRIFDHGECNFNTPLLFVENDELEVNSRNGYIAKSKSKLPRKAKKKRKRRRKELAKLTFTKYPLSDSEEESINNELKETKRTKKLKKRHMSDKSETGSVGPLDTALSCSSGSEWNISSSEMSVSSSHNSTSTISESSYIESEYLSSHLSPRPVTRKTCWPIDGKLRNLPPITKKIQSDPQQQGNSV